MSNKINDGGPAFPMASGPCNDFEHGMSLRDWFAGQALVGMMSSPGDYTAWENAEGFAKAAYIAADAMLRAREVKP